MKVFTSKSQSKGKIGEDIALKYLENKGFRLVERNHTKPWGEIDIIVKDKDTTHLVEVKSVSAPGLTIDTIRIRPEENLHGQKIERLKRVIETYVGGTGNTNMKWQFDLVCVYIDDLKKRR